MVTIVLAVSMALCESVGVGSNPTVTPNICPFSSMEEWFLGMKQVVSSILTKGSTYMLL